MYGLLTWLPSFYSERYGVAVADLGGYTLAPYVLQGVLGLGAGALADKLIDAWSSSSSGDGGGGEARGGVLSLSPSSAPSPPPPSSSSSAADRRAAAVRRVRVSLQLAGMLGPAACLLVAVSPLAAGDARTASAAVTLGLALSALTLGGVSASHLDVAPKHAGAVFGAGNTAATLAGLVATPLTGLVLRWTGGSWAWVFGLVAAHYVAGSVAWAGWAGDRPLPEDDDDDDGDGGAERAAGGWRDGADAA
jgi:ACS family sodium-dependent inorganic phosphate cotransporter